MSGICYILGAYSDGKKINIDKKHNDLVIAADGGYSLIEDKSLIDIVLGDFDSINEEIQTTDVVKYPVEKDDTDLFLAYKTAQKYGYKDYLIYGGIGGRIDHTFANIQMLTSMAENGHRGFLLGEGTIITLISDSFIEFSPKKQGIVSVFCMGDRAEGVNIEGLKYTLDNATLNKSFPLGISNEFIGEKAKISVHNGTLMIIWYENTPNTDELFTF